MIFSLEVLQAKHGDCFLLHFGDSEAQELILIDGGPSGVYENFLKPRLIEIKDRKGLYSPLVISLVMVSHMDDDHVNGILNLTGDVLSDIEDSLEPKFEILKAWFNSFDDIIGNVQISEIGNMSPTSASYDIERIPELDNVDNHISAVIASTRQGRRLKLHFKKLFSEVNNNLNFLFSEVGNNLYFFGDHLQIKIIHPNKKRVKEMQKKWDQDLTKAKKNGDNSIIYASLSVSNDTSPFNLASIVCLIEFQSRSILFTGDARGDDIVQGLKIHNLLNENGEIRVDVFKIPHHGSCRNSSIELYRTILANYYIISGDGKHGNPDMETLKMIEKATRRIHDGFTIFLTNFKGKNELEQKVKLFVDFKNKMNRSFNLQCIPQDQSSLVIDLLDKLGY